MKTGVRSKFIDVMKGVLITFVVIGHLNFFEYDSRTLTLIYSFHMPAFLIIGGILSHVNEDTPYKNIIIKRIRHILVPYFVFYLISLIIVPVSTMELRLKAIECIFNGIGNPNYAINLPLWFLPFYFVAMLTFETIEYISYKLKIAIYGKKNRTGTDDFYFVQFATLCFIIIIMYASYYYAKIYHGTRLPFNIEIAGFCLGFVYFGKLASVAFPSAVSYIKKSTILTVISFFVVIFTILGLIVIWYHYSMQNGRIDLNARDYKNAFLMYVNAITGFILLAYFSFVLTYIPIIKDALSTFGENSMYILAYHVPSSFLTHCFIIPISETRKHEGVVLPQRTIFAGTPQGGI